MHPKGERLIQHNFIVIYNKNRTFEGLPRPDKKASAGYPAL
jgi:hypothetical protein